MVFTMCATPATRCDINPTAGGLTGGIAWWRRAGAAGAGVREHDHAAGSAHRFALRLLASNLLGGGHRRARVDLGQDRTTTPVPPRSSLVRRRSKGTYEHRRPDQAGARHLFGA